MKKSIFLFLAAFLCATNAFALSDSQSWYDGNKPYLYFNNTNAKYNGVSLIQGRQWTWGSGGIGSSGYGMTEINNTNLYYLYTQLYDKFTTQCFVDRAGGNGWSDWSSDPVAKRVTTYASNYTDSYNLTFTSNKYYVFTASTSSKNSALELSINAGSSYTDLNKTITVKAKVSTDNGATYLEATSPGTLSANSYKFSDYKTCGTATILSSGTISCGYTANTALTAQTDIEGYVFAGWYNASGIKQTSDATLTIRPTANATYYAYYVAEAKHTVTISYKYGSTDIKPSITKEVGESIKSEIEAEIIDGYTFSSWTLGSGVESADATANPISITTKASGDYTLTANYNEDLTTGWVLRGSFVDDFATAYDFVKESGESTGKVAYTTLDLDAYKEYHFKVVNGSTWYGNNNYNEGNEEHWIKQTAENWEFYSDAGDCYMKSGLAGTYTFKIDYSGTYPKVSIYYPEIYAIVGSFNDWNEKANPLAFNGNEGTTTINLQASATNYEFKVIDNAVHGGMTSKTITQTESNMVITVGGGDNIMLTANAYPSGNYIFTYDKSTKKLSVKYPNIYTVTATANPVEGGSIEGARQYAEGTTATLTATANPGYEFIGWSNGETANPYTFTVTEDVDLVANFKATTITLTTGNNDDVIAANIGNTVDVVIERSFTANDGYYTLCVPFNMPASVIGKAYSLGTITEHVAGEGININLKEENELSAGMPYLVLPKEDMTQLVVENVTIAEDDIAGQGVSNEEGTVKIFFQGYYSASGQTNGSTEYYVGNTGYLYNKVVDIRGLCGLFTITDKNGDPLKVRARVVTREDAATGFENITNGENTTIKTIENGQFIIIRNGEKFNAQGQRL